MGIFAGIVFAGEVTFNRDVAPILYKRCVACHRPGDIAPMSLLTYKDARPWAAAIKEAVLSRKMPPWKADPHYGQWSNDPRLSDSEIGSIRSWVDGAKVEGDPKDLPVPLDFHDGWKIGKPDLVISIPEHKIEGSGPDEYSYFSVPTNFKEARWIAAAELRPSNRKIVHHAHVFVEGDSEKKAAPAKDPVADYNRWLFVHEGTLSWMRPDAPVIDNGCSVDDNGLPPGKKLSNVELRCLLLSARTRCGDLSGGERLENPRRSYTLNFKIHYSRTRRARAKPTRPVWAFIFCEDAARARPVLHIFVKPDVPDSAWRSRPYRHRLPHLR